MNFVTLNLNNIENILQLQDLVYDKLPKKEVLEKLTAAEFKTCLAQGYVVGVFSDNNLIAVRTMYIPSVDETEHLADDIEVSKNRSIYSEISLVHPEYRGQKLQTGMGQYLLERVRASGEFDHVLSTVMPTNLASLKDKFKLGFIIMRTKLKYGGKRRHVLYLPLRKEVEMTGEPLEIKYDNFDWMMTQGTDYIGVNLQENHIVYYQK